MWWQITSESVQFAANCRFERWREQLCRCWFITGQSSVSVKWQVLRTKNWILLRDKLCKECVWFKYLFLRPLVTFNRLHAIREDTTRIVLSVCWKWQNFLAKCLNERNKQTKKVAMKWESKGNKERIGGRQASQTLGLVLKKILTLGQMPDNRSVGNIVGEHDRLNAKSTYEPKCLSIWTLVFTTVHAVNRDPPHGVPFVTALPTVAWCLSRAVKRIEVSAEI